jgi:peptidoglycan hydrolase-like protein with peptidoglycan-binding domain
MPGIFINYRRDDAAGFARSLYEHLDQEFRQGQVFMDVEALREPGIDFAKEIDRSLGRCAAMLVLIGKSWISSKDEAGRRRIDEAEDFVRLEIATALKRDVRVIPVLLGGATMPRAEELPADLQAIGRRQAISLTHDDWAHDVSRLVEALAKVPGIRKRSKRGQTGWSTRSMIIAGGVGGAVALAGLVWTGYKFETRNDAPAPTPAVYTDPGPTDAQTWMTAPLETTPAPQPEPLEPAVPAASSDDVYHVQSLLDELGYQPGVADGINGAATVAAIRAFQYDQGLADTGNIDGALIAQLESAASQARSAQSASLTNDVVEQPAAYTEPDVEALYRSALDALSSMTVDVNGMWYDENGNQVMLMQSGDSVTVSAYNPVTSVPQIIGSGTVQGRAVTINYENFAGVPGTVHAELAPDGTHLNGTDTNALLNVPVPNTWHREHLPGQ